VIEYLSSLGGVDEGDLEGFFEGWPERPSSRTLLRALRGSEHVVLARDLETGRVIGFVTAVGDGVLAAFLPLLEVLPERQGQGIGSELVRRILAHLEGRYAVDLCCDEELAPFYARFGMQRLVGMGLRDRGALAELAGNER
jgi:predicted N-acetyltransferase YhbS